MGSEGLLAFLTRFFAMRLVYSRSHYFDLRSVPLYSVCINTGEESMLNWLISKLLDYLDNLRSEIGKETKPSRAVLRKPLMRQKVPHK